MSGFTSPIDICNRGLDHCGARRITAFSDGSRNALVCSGVYDRLRQAELRRNLWRFATRKAAIRPIDNDTFTLVPLGYNPATPYEAGTMVTYLGSTWVCVTEVTGIAPVDSNGVVAAAWDDYFGSLTVDQWVDPAPGNNQLNAPPWPNSYHAGEMAYLSPGDGSAITFLSLVDGNNDDPLDPQSWVSTTLYVTGQLVTGSNGTIYRSTANFNQGTDPVISISVSDWSNLTTYAIGDYALYPDNQIYQSLTGGNLANVPPASPTNWNPTGGWGGMWDTVITPTPRSTSNNWSFLACSLQRLQLVYPVGAGPLSQSNSANVFRLPSNYLHQAPTDSKKGTVPWVGGPSGVLPDDWIFQGQYLISNTVTPILIRFVSDFHNVAQMDPMFCEGLAARIGMEVCETLTQAPDKKAFCAAQYKLAMGEARTINAIEVGPIDPPIDDYILVRQ